MATSEHRKVFATLHPRNRDAFRVFSNVCVAVQQQSERHRHHARYIHTNELQVTLREALGRLRSQNSPVASPSLSFSSEGTVVDDENDPLSDQVYTGWYEFSLNAAPQWPKLGWRAGYGVRWHEDPYGRIDLLIATKEDASRYNVHGNHLIFNLLEDSGAFAVRCLYEDGTTRMGSTIIQRSHGFVALRGMSQAIMLGDLEFELIYTAFDDKNDEAFQVEKSRYMTTILELEMPISHTLVTPSMHDIVIGDWRILKTAGAGTQVVIKAAIGPYGRLVAVRILRGDKDADHDIKVDNLRFLDKCLKDVNHSDHVQRLCDVLGPQGGDKTNDVYVLFRPLARGDLRNMVLQNRDEILHDIRLALFAQTIAGVSAIHEAQILHRDISPANIGVVSLRPPHIVILDFGHAWYLGSSGSIDCTPGVTGTPGFLSPEREIVGNSYGYPSDVWSVGVVGFDLLYGPRRWANDNNPWRDPSTLDTSIDLHSLRDEIAIFQESRQFLATRPPDSVGWILSRMLIVDPDLRAPIREALRHTSIDSALKRDTSSSSNGRKRAAEF